MTDPAQKPQRDRFAFLIPVYNHAAQLPAVVAGVRQYGCPVFVVDDGSTDETRQRLAALEGVELLRHPHNRGKGAALLTGMAAAARVADWAITLDADGQHDPADAAALMAAARKRPRSLLLGNRLGMLGPHIPWTSRFGRGFSNFWVRAAGGPRVADSQSGYRVYPLPEVLRWGARSRRFQFEVEILVLARWHGMPVSEVDISVHYAPRGERVSHFKPWTDFWRNSATFSGLIARRLLLSRRRRARLLPPPGS
jgi:glycosyltransferase involved in cell wall biosynthesis